MHEHCKCGGCAMNMDDNAIKNTPQMPLIGDAAPEFVANTTNGVVRFPSDYMGRWVVLFSHPADFTPVCTTEFITFQSILDKFKELNTDIIGLSIGTLPGHLAWIDSVRNLEYRGMRDVQISFPIIDDMKMEVARKYGMIHPHASDTRAVRAVFIIDPAGIIRTILYYPLTIGRNFDEILRVLTALQVTDAFGVSTPADWQPGEPVVVPAPTTQREMNIRMRNKSKDVDVKSWYLTLRDLPADEIWKKLKH